MGNSYTSVNSLPQLVHDLALSTGDSIIHDQSTIGGARFLTHVANAGTQAKIKADDWDYVVLQAQSQEPSFALTQVETEVFPYAKELCDSIRANNPCSQPLFFMTWGRENGDAGNCEFWEPLCTYEGMDSLLNLRYQMMAEMNMADLSPVGAVWNNIRQNYPEIQLYSGDGSHPAFSGSYAAACSFYALILEKDPTLITDNKSLDDETAAIIKAAAKEVAFDQLAMWKQDRTPNADFSFSIDSLTVHFDPVEEGAESYTWDFGDGNTSNEEEPVHIYAGQEDLYTINLTTVVCGSSSTFEMLVTLDYEPEMTGLNSTVASKWNFFPNPASKQLTIENSNESEFALNIYDANGRLHIVLENPATIDLSDFAKGIYLFKIQDKKTLVEFSKRILVD